MSLIDKLAEAGPTPDDLLNSDLQRSKDRVAKKQMEAAYKAALSKIEDLQDQVGLLTALGERPARKPAPEPKRSRGHATALLNLSDWHIEEPVYAPTVNGVNEYNLEIAQRRVKKVFEKALLLLEDSRHMAKIDELVVALLGDFITSWLHPENIECNLLTPDQAILLATDMIEDGILTLVKHAKVSRIRIPTAVGNHARQTLKPRNSNMMSTSREYTMYLHLRRRLKAVKCLDWQIGESYLNYQDIQGYTVRFHHGDALKYHGGVGGPTIAINKAEAQWDKGRKANYSFFGHLHQFIPYGKWNMNGSVIGFNAFALKIKADPSEPPRQMFAVIDKNHGLTRVLPVFCE